ncbi:MAG: hypothetical protein ACRD26_17170, partial [Vicinamibacterales bacterium]
LGIAQPPPVRLQIHDSLEAFRDATGRPWWVTVAVAGSTVDLVPLAILEQRDGLDAFVRRGIAEVLMGETFAGRPAWVRVGGARYYASVTRPTPPKRAECPSDAELLMAVSAPAYRVAELRAEACFARALAKTGDWRRVE